MNSLNTSVVICGAGPVGLILAHSLVQDGIDTIVIEKLPATMDEPRAIAIDGESLRALQKLGLLEGLRADFLEGIRADYVNGKGELLFTAGRSEFRPYGHEMVSSFDQPTLDRYLAQQLQESGGHARLLFNHTLTGFQQDESGVKIECLDELGEPLVILSQYLVGCDGGRSSVRSQLGIHMIGESNPQPWLVIDTKDPVLGEEMPCRFFCDPARPGMTILKRHGERRWEWMLMPGEEPEFLLQDDTIRGLIAPYTDADRVTVFRKKVYDFHALIAERWREGRVFLAGDAAHMTPPFAGQGLNSGIRDASNLAWKLALVISEKAAPAILDSYEKDRVGHARQLIEIATNLGSQIQPIDPTQAAERDAFFAALQKDPAAMETFEQQLLTSLAERIADTSLCITGAEDAVATKLLIQPELRLRDRRLLLDDALGASFAILGINCDPSDSLAVETLAAWSRLGARVVRIESGAAAPNSDHLVDEKGALTGWLGGDEPTILLVRPDRFCMAQAAPASADEVLRAAHRLLAGAPAQS